MKARTRIRNALISAISGALMLVLLLPSLTLVAPSVLPPRSTPSPGAPTQRKPPTGAYIVLHMTSAPAEVWTVVQWQDALGDWHDVEGWQGTLDNSYSKLWWVAKKDFATGPFRWAIHKNRDGRLLAVSEPFHLPDTLNETVLVEISLNP
jgi:hypothetical protein